MNREDPQTQKEKPSAHQQDSLARALGWVASWLWVFLLAAVLFSTFFPILGRRLQHRQGEECAANLELIFQAKEKLARDLHLDPGRPFPPIVANLEPKDLFPYLEHLKDDFSCPAGGTYKIQPLVDENGEIVPPVCDKESVDPDGNGVPNRGEGLHIHRRSHLQDPETAEWFRDPAFVFP